MHYFNDAIRAFLVRDPQRLPELKSYKRLEVFSDYGGDHQDCDFNVVSSLIFSLESAEAWDRERWAVRQEFLPDGRHMEFKKLNKKDGVRQRALIPFLAASELLPGLLVSIAVHKRIDSLFVYPEFVEADGEFFEYAHWPQGTLERALRVIHFTAFFLAGLTSSGQDILYVTDQDEIAANDTRLCEFTKAFGNVLSYYLPHCLGHLRIGTTRKDDATHRLEDLASIPDLAAGAVASYATELWRQGLIPTAPLILPPPKGILPKTELLMRWTGIQTGLLRKLVCMIYPQNNDGTGSLVIKWIRYGEQ